MIIFSRRICTDIHVEVRVVNIETEDSLPEVDMTYAVCADVAVIDSELDIGRNCLDKGSGGSDIVVTLDQLRVRAGNCLSRIGVCSSGSQAVLVEINQSLR